MTMHLTCYLKSVVQFGRRLHCPKHCVLVFLFVVVLRSAIARLRVARSKQKQVFRDGLLDMYMNELDSGAYDHVRYVLRMLPLHRKPLPQSAWRLLMAFGERDPAFCNFIICALLKAVVYSCAFRHGDCCTIALILFYNYQRLSYHSCWRCLGYLCVAKKKTL